jgi:ribose transport system ATP-binding protein
VRSWLALADIRPGDPSKPMSELSGGNQQKVLLARWLRAGLRLLLVDEPTQGVDVGAVERIYGLIRDSASHGTAFVICSSSAEELETLCTRVLVMRRGHIMRELLGDDIRRDLIDQECLTSSSSHTENHIP